MMMMNAFTLWLAWSVYYSTEYTSKSRTESFKTKISYTLWGPCGLHGPKLHVTCINLAITTGMWDQFCRANTLEIVFWFFVHASLIRHDVIVCYCVCSKPTAAQLSVEDERAIKCCHRLHRMEIKRC